MKKMLFGGMVLALLFCGCSAKKTGEADVPTLIWWQIGSSQDISEDLKTISDYTQEKIGVRVDIKQAGWGDATQRFTTMINAGEYFDILFTDIGSYNRYVSLGALADLTDMVGAEVPKLVSSLPDVLWEGVKVKGRIYSIPTYKDSSKTMYYFWDHSLVEKYGLDISDPSWANLDRLFRTIKAGEGQRYYPFVLAKDASLHYNWYDSLTGDLPPMGVRVDDPQHRVVNTLEQADILSSFNYLHQWYEAGIINPDANMEDQTPPNRPFFIAQAWPAVAASYATSAGIEQYDPVRYFGPSYSTDSIQGSMNGISVNSKYKKEALKLLELVNTDTKLRDMMAYGIEGKHFTYVNGGSAVRRDQTNWPLINYQEGSFFIETPENTVPDGYWDQVRQLNEEAVPSVMLGFMLDMEPIRTELINCQSAWNKYKTDLNTGASDPAVVIPQLMTELRNAGFEKVMQEAQRQVDEFFRTNG
ncbi:MAG: ABC transporter substrate-binding protein [Spirochaetaceae bacterium]|nr:ABC transporter substrate-binding protein [Spirochaetaceae bacterium]